MRKQCTYIAYYTIWNEVTKLLFVPLFIKSDPWMNLWMKLRISIKLHFTFRIYALVGPDYRHHIYEHSDHQCGSLRRLLCAYRAWLPGRKRNAACTCCICHGKHRASCFKWWIFFNASTVAPCDVRVSYIRLFFQGKMESF